MADDSSPSAQAPPPPANSAASGNWYVAGVRLLAVPVDVDGEELLLPSTEGVSEPWRLAVTSRWRDDVVLDRRGIGMDRKTGCGAFGRSGWSSSGMVSSLESYSISSSSSP